MTLNLYVMLTVSLREKWLMVVVVAYPVAVCPKHLNFHKGQVICTSLLKACLVKAALALHLYLPELLTACHVRAARSLQIYLLELRQSLTVTATMWGHAIMQRTCYIHTGCIHQV